MLQVLWQLPQLSDGLTGLQIKLNEQLKTTYTIIGFKQVAKYKRGHHPPDEMGQTLKGSRTDRVMGINQKKIARRFGIS